MTKIAVLGYGTVGSGVVEVIQTNRDLINQKTGDSLEIKYISGKSYRKIDCT